MTRHVSASRVHTFRLGLLAGLATLIVAAAAHAQVPSLMNFQGLLLDANGQPKNGTVTLVIELFAEASGGNPLWSESHPSVWVTDGVYDVVLGGTTPLTTQVFSSAARYVQITVDGEVLAPRRQLLAVPYALRAAVADSALGASTAYFADNATMAGSAATAGALASNGANCPVGQASQGIDAAGAAEGCFTPLPALGGALTGDLEAGGFDINNLGSITTTDTNATWNFDDSALGEASQRALLRMRSDHTDGAISLFENFDHIFGFKWGYYFPWEPSKEYMVGYITAGGSIHTRAFITVNGTTHDALACEWTIPGGTEGHDCRIQQADWGTTYTGYMIGARADIAPGGATIFSRSYPDGPDIYGGTQDTTTVFRVSDAGMVYGSDAAAGDVASPISPTDTRCFQRSGLNEGDDDVNLPQTWFQPVKIKRLGCRTDTSASPTTAATVAIETLTGSAIGDAATCVGSQTAMTWTDVSADADAILASGAGIRFDVTNTPDPATDAYTICVAYVSKSP